MKVFNRESPKRIRADADESVSTSRKLRRRFAEMELDLDEVSDDVAGHTLAIAAVQSAVDALEANDTVQDASIADLDSRVTALETP